MNQDKTDITVETYQKIIMEKL